MKRVTVHLTLPDDMSERCREIAGDRPLKFVILEALREQWFPDHVVLKSAFTGEPELVPIEEVHTYTIYGSIPAPSIRTAPAIRTAEQKAHG